MALAAGYREGIGIDHDGQRAEQEAVHLFADVVAHLDVDAAARALQHRAIGCAQHGAIGHMASDHLTVGDIGRQHQAGQFVDDEQAPAHGPVDLGIEVPLVADIGAVRHGEPTGDTNVGTVGHITVGVHQGAFRQPDADIAAARHADLGAQRQIAVLGGQGDVAAGGADAGIHVHFTADTAGIETDTAAGGADAMGADGDGAVNGGDVHHVAHPLVDALDDQVIVFLDGNLAGAGIGEIERPHLGLDGVGDGTDPAAGDDDQARVRRDDVERPFTGIHDAAADDADVIDVGGAQLAEQDGTIGLQRDTAGTGVQGGFAGHLEDTRARVQGDVAGNAGDGRLFGQPDAGRRAEGDTAADRVDGLVQMEPARAGGQVHRVGAAGDHGAIQNQVAAGADVDRAAAAVETGDGERIVLGDGHGATGDDIQRRRVQIDADRAGRLQADAVCISDVTDGDGTVQRDDVDVAGRAGDGVDVDIAISDDVDVAAVHGDAAQIQIQGGIAIGVAGLVDGEVAGAGQGDRHVHDVAVERQVAAGADGELSRRDLVAEGESGAGIEDHRAAIAGIGADVDLGYHHQGAFRGQVDQFVLVGVGGQVDHRQVAVLAIAGIHVHAEAADVACGQDQHVVADHGYRIAGAAESVVDGAATGAEGRIGGGCFQGERAAAGIHHRGDFAIAFHEVFQRAKDGRPVRRHHAVTGDVVTDFYGVVGRIHGNAEGQIAQGDARRGGESQDILLESTRACRRAGRGTIGDDAADRVTGADELDRVGLERKARVVGARIQGELELGDIHRDIDGLVGLDLSLEIPQDGGPGGRDAVRAHRAGIGVAIDHDGETVAIAQGVDGIIGIRRVIRRVVEHHAALLLGDMARGHRRRGRIRRQCSHRADRDGVDAERCVVAVGLQAQGLGGGLHRRGDPVIPVDEVLEAIQNTGPGVGHADARRGGVDAGHRIRIDGGGQADGQVFRRIAGLGQIAEALVSNTQSIVVPRRHHDVVEVDVAVHAVVHAADPQRLMAGVGHRRSGAGDGHTEGDGGEIGIGIQEQDIVVAHSHVVGLAVQQHAVDIAGAGGTREADHADLRMGGIGNLAHLGATLVEVGDGGYRHLVDTEWRVQHFRGQGQALVAVVLDHTHRLAGLDLGLQFGQQGIPVGCHGDATRGGGGIGGVVVDLVGQAIDDFRQGGVGIRVIDERRGGAYGDAVGGVVHRRQVGQVDHPPGLAGVGHADQFEAGHRADAGGGDDLGPGAAGDRDGRPRGTGEIARARVVLDGACQARRDSGEVVAVLRDIVEIEAVDRDGVGAALHRAGAGEVDGAVEIRVGDVCRVDGGGRARGTERDRGGTGAIGHRDGVVDGGIVAGVVAGADVDQVAQTIDDLRASGAAVGREGEGRGTADGDTVGGVVHHGDAGEVDGPVGIHVGSMGCVDRGCIARGTEADRHDAGAIGHRDTAGGVVAGVVAGMAMDGRAQIVDDFRQGGTAVRRIGEGGGVSDRDAVGLVVLHRDAGEVDHPIVVGIGDVGGVDAGTGYAGDGTGGVEADIGAIRAHQIDEVVVPHLGGIFGAIDHDTVEIAGGYGNAAAEGHHIRLVAVLARSAQRAAGIIDTAQQCGAVGFGDAHAIDAEGDIGGFGGQDQTGIGDGHGDGFARLDLVFQAAKHGTPAGGHAVQAHSGRIGVRVDHHGVGITGSQHVAEHHLADLRDRAAGRRIKHIGDAVDAAACRIQGIHVHLGVAMGITTAGRAHLHFVTDAGVGAGEQLLGRGNVVGSRALPHLDTVAIKVGAAVVVGVAGDGPLGVVLRRGPLVDAAPGIHQHGAAGLLGARRRARFHVIHVDVATRLDGDAVAVGVVAHRTQVDIAGGVDVDGAVLGDHAFHDQTIGFVDADVAGDRRFHPDGVDQGIELHAVAGRDLQGIGDEHRGAVRADGTGAELEHALGHIGRDDAAFHGQRALDVQGDVAG